MGEMSMIDRVAGAMEDVDLGYSIQLIRLVDGVSTYQLTDSDRGDALQFPSHLAALEHIQEKNRRLRASAAIEAMKPISNKMDVAGAIYLRENHSDASGCFEAMITAALEEK